MSYINAATVFACYWALQLLFHGQLRPANCLRNPMRTGFHWMEWSHLRNASVFHAAVAVMVAQMPLCERFRAPGWWQRVRRSGGLARDGRPYSAFETALGASWELPVPADVNSYGEFGTAVIRTLLEVSGAAARSGGYVEKSPKSGSCDARALASLEGKAQTATILLKARGGDSS